MAVDARALVGARTGIGVYTAALLSRLLDESDLAFVAMAHRPPEGIEALTERGLRCETQAAPLGILWQQARLPHRLARGDVDLLWSPLFTLPLRLAVPAVVTAHDLTTVLLPRLHRWQTRWTISPFLSRSLARARRVVAVSETTAADLRRLYPACAERLAVIHNGVDPEFQPATPQAIAATRAELGCPRGFAFYAGTLEPRKNIDRLLDAWQELRRPGAVDLPLLLAGPYGWASRALAGRLTALADHGVRYLGPLPRSVLVATLQAATLFVYPSLYEGFGLPAAEAMACGVPVVASDTPALTEVVGEAGLLVPATDTGALAASLALLAGDPALRAELGRRGRERSRRFSWDAAAERLATVFREALL